MYACVSGQIERTGWNSDGLTRLFTLFIKNRDSKQSRYNHTHINICTYIYVCVDYTWNE